MGSNWLIETSIVFTVLYGIFYLFFRKNTFHRINRFLMISIIGLSLLVPQLEIDMFSSYQNIDQYILDQYVMGIDSDSEVIIPLKEFRSMYSGKMIQFVYLIGVGISALLFVWRLISIFRVRLRAKKEVYQGRVIYLTHHPGAPFTFFRWIFISETRNGTLPMAVLDHEQAHVEQRHSIDLLLSNLFRIVFWFNPFVYLFHRSLLQIHEFLADEAGIKSSQSTIDYLRLLASELEQKVFVGVTNQFNYLIIKRRIKMLTKNKTKSVSLLNYLFFIPVMIILLASFGKVQNNQIQPPELFPIPKTVKHKITSHFGIRVNPISKKKQKHNGMDISAPSGTSVYASADGKVMKVLDSGNKGYGKRIIISHGETYSTSYSQLSAFKVNEGDLVKKGEVIGLVGSSGASTGPHLHFEVIEKGEYVDPKPFVIK